MVSPAGKPNGERRRGHDLLSGAMSRSRQHLRSDSNPLNRTRVEKTIISCVETLSSPRVTLAWCRPLLRMAGRRSDKSTGRVSGAREVLVIKPDGIGDLIMAIPFLRELRRAWPAARISIVVSAHAANFIETCPYVDRILPFRLPPDSRWWRPLTRRLAVLSFARRYLWPTSYDLAIVPRWGPDIFESPFLAFLSGAPWRVSFSTRASADREMLNRGDDQFFTHTLTDRSVCHEVRRNLGLLSLLGVDSLEDRLAVWLSDDDELFADRVLTTILPKPVVAIGPGAGNPKRMWPIQRFVEVARWLENRGFALVLIGGSGEEALGEELRRSLDNGVIDLTGRATLRQSAAVLQRCVLFCGNDAGPMHLAAAAGIPVVEISCHPRGGDDLHPNSPTRFGPWGVPNTVVRPDEPTDGCATGCRAPAPHCIANVPVASVIAGIASLLDERTAPGRSADAS